MKELIVTKASGEQVVFEMDKLRQSLRNSGATEEQIEKVVQTITPKLYQGIPTKQIYKWAFGSLKRRSSDVAARYQLKRAIMDFGPSGFPFERFIGELYRRMGYRTKVSTIVKGTCVNHEVDVIASIETEHLLVECKSHSQAGKMSDVKVPLYIQSRFLDVKSQWDLVPELQKKSIQGWVVTNTRFSPDAVKYARCIGLNLLSWDYPLNKCLKDLIDEHHMYPLTCLTTITDDEKKKLLEKDLVLCSELINDPEILRNIGIHKDRLTKILEEVKRLVKP
jgi:hypothetical protein